MHNALCIIGMIPLINTNKKAFPSPYLGTKADYAVDVIRTAILVGELQPGQRVTEQQFKEMLGISSSPIREAFNKLEAEGFLTKTSHVGSMVTKLEIEDTRELYQVQAMLQSTCMQLCTGKLPARDIKEARRLNEEMRKVGAKEPIDVRLMRVLNYKFHILLCGASVYPWLTRLVSALWIRLPSQRVWLIPGRPRISVKQHDKILKMAAKGDRQGAALSMKEHLESSMNALYKLPPNDAGAAERADRREEFFQDVQD